MKHTLRRRPIAVFSVLIALALGLAFAPLWSASCATVPPQPGSEAARLSLQNMMRAATPPNDDALARIETENANTNVAALARLARAQLAFARNDFNRVISILDTASLRLINTATALGDEALFTRAEALARLNRPTEARAAFEQLAREHTESLRERTAILRASEIAAQTGASGAVPLFVKSLTDKDDAAALLLAAQAYEQTDATRARAMYRRLYFYAPASDEARTAAVKLGIAPNTVPNTTPSDATPEEAITRADKLFAAKQHLHAANAYTFAFARFPALATAVNQLKRGQAAANARRSADAVSALRAIPTSAEEHAEALYHLALVHTRDRQWDLAKSVTEEARRIHPQNLWTAQAFVAAGMEAKTRGFSVGAQDFFRAAVAQFPGAAEVAGAQFELAWAAHERKDYLESSRLLIEHLANYADKNTDSRGRAGYWAARDSQLAGRFQEAAELYNAMLVRYDANWYGYLSKQRLDEMKRANQVTTQVAQVSVSSASSTSLTRAVANLQPVTVAVESADLSITDRAIAKAEQLATINMDDAAFAELRHVSVDAPDSPRVNLAIARLHQLRFEMVEAFSQLRRSFPDYSQMNPEEMTPEEWTIFYPLSNWQTIKTEAAKNSLDPYTVAGLIRQESVYDPRAASPAKAYGLMQLLIPTAQTTARRAGINRTITVNTLFEPALNIQLGTAYMREQFDKFARLEYVAAAYNAGPGRAVRWRAELPLQIDEWAEAIPFRETRGYVQGVIRNKLQYQRLYDEQGRFRPNVGTNASTRLASPPTNNATNADAVRPRRTASPEE
ncbi:MAG: lytic transglycosylase domain-containing protein [Pyrinomonadaceae bacterium MAG19_C2-C3]|nr:lytic transglycosylase domain-containing protein [Pyrinomonadaceae bacterium MAG19_C2-C3]